MKKVLKHEWIPECGDTSPSYKKRRWECKLCGDRRETYADEELFHPDVLELAEDRWPALARNDFEEVANIEFALDSLRDSLDESQGLLKHYSSISYGPTSRQPYRESGIFRNCTYPKRALHKNHILRKVLES